MQVVSIARERCHKQKIPQVILPRCKKGQIWVAGGAARTMFTGGCSRDIDVFPENEEIEKAFLRANRLDQHPPSRETPLMREWGNIQVMQIYSKNVRELFGKFDFTICCFAWDGEKLWATVDAIIDALRRRLVVNRIQEGFEVSTLERLVKYERQGFRSCAGTMATIAETIAKLTPKNIRDQVILSPARGTRQIVRID